MSRRFEHILWILAFGLVLIAYIFGLFIDLTGDSGLYAAITRQMVESGDWLNLKINGVPYDQKPHLFFWLAGIGVKFFGNTNFAFKLFPFLYGVTGVYFTFRLGKQIFSSETGKLAALITGTSQMYFLYFFDFHTDTVLQTGVVLAMWQLAAYLQHKKPLNFVFGFVGIGLAMFAKGPIGAVLPFLGVLFYLLATKDYKQIFNPKWLLGVLIVLVIISPSLIQLYQNFGIKGLKFYFITNNVGRITGEVAGSSTEYIFYIHTLLWAFLPWTVLVVAAIYSEIKSWFQKAYDKSWGVFLLGSVLVLLLVFSLSRGKAPNYFLIMVSPIAVVTAKWIFGIASNPKALKRILDVQPVFVGMLGTGLMFILHFMGFAKLWVSILTSLLFIGTVMVLLWGRKLNIQTTVFISVILIAGFNLYFNLKVYPDLYSYQGAKQVLKIYNKKSDQGDQLCNFDVEQYELFFYSNPKVNEITNWDDLKNKMSTPGVWLYTNEIKYNEIINMEFNIEEIYIIKFRGMNKVNLDFLNLENREYSLKTNYILKVGQKNYD